MNVIVKEGVSYNQNQLYYYFDGNEWVKKWEGAVDTATVVMENFIQETEHLRSRVLAGLSSPLEYHMQFNLFNISILSSYTGISKRRIRKHLKPNNFNQLDEEILNKYAMAFGMSIEKLKTV